MSELNAVSDLAACVDVSTGVTDGDSADNLSMVQHTQLTGMARDTRTDQSISREWHRLHLTVSAHMERVGTIDITMLYRQSHTN